ncbi:hypothetical protein Bca52824_018103 [Brassica carinata]|uniref:Zinc knuckle CX2CX4HX4C domain-containing protein n=1 Tax=Brassica carinata TaxID=52824 RepID=A0A8X7VPA5_BRACI|nr:hypothetical protein Bca52824_018103 [Brassica carinata]
MRVFVDGLNPLTTESVIEFSSAEESLITLEYEGLKNHCTLCYRLSHLSPNCPYRDPPLHNEARKENTTGSPIGEQDAPPKEYVLASAQNCRPRSPTPKAPPFIDGNTEKPHFSQRRDRNGNPFGERIYKTQLGSGP